MTEHHHTSAATTGPLKPCPFCGGAMVEVTDEDGHYFAHPGRNGLERADCWLSDAWVSDEATGEGSIGEWNTRAGPTEPLQCLRCGTVDAFGPSSKKGASNG
jgi:hypothetical protein